MTVWGWIGFDAIIYLAALPGRAARAARGRSIDGARSWSIFRNVTLPLLGPATLFLVVFSSINALQVFDEGFYFLTKGGPGSSTYVLCSTSSSSPSSRASRDTRRRSPTCCSSRS